MFVRVCKGVRVAVTLLLLSDGLEKIKRTLALAMPCTTPTIYGGLDVNCLPGAELYKCCFFTVYSLMCNHLADWTKCLTFFHTIYKFVLTSD